MMRRKRKHGTKMADAALGAHNALATVVSWMREKYFSDFRIELDLS